MTEHTLFPLNEEPSLSRYVHRVMTTGQAPERDTLSDDDDDDVYYCTGERLKLDARKGDGEWWCLSEEAESMTAVVHNVPLKATPCSGTALMH